MVMASMSRSLQDQVAVAVDAAAPARRNDGGGVELLDDGGTGNNRADIKTIAVVESRLHRTLAVEMDAALALDRDVARTGRGRYFLRPRLVFRHRHPHAHPIAHHLDGSFLGSMPVNLRVALIEPLASGGERVAGQPFGKQAFERRAQFIALAGVS